RFITPLSVELAAGNAVYTDMFESPLSHVNLTAKTDIFVIAPATANIIGKYANAIADDLLSTTLLAFNGKVIIAPAMNWRMYENPLFQRNLKRLLLNNVRAVGPDYGGLACGEEGMGRMANVECITEAIKTALTNQDLKGQKVIITAGPTREHIDPVRYLSNRSSGKMGYALARIARRRGADVTLISGTVSISAPDDVNVISVESADEMYEAVIQNAPMSSLLIMAAAVADFTPAKRQETKLEKSTMLQPPKIDIVRTRDILQDTARLKNRPFIVGFSAETGLRIDNARKKLLEKNIDMIVFNDVGRRDSGFDVDTNEVVIIMKETGEAVSEVSLPLMSKEDVADAIIDRIIHARDKGKL
ncbi:MAG: bifunctional phosphopantothenoylcysteine decarboxylase/phosphopantothenate--cysteine ligase CoaBC, partial [Nitrospirae bacterium]|nr:bifunctional phosphopantothenoylcysteine decarboxylase/phosphopantothenate--cysteine ligase CoaBC [Nitrospirota bacterium]